MNLNRKFCILSVAILLVVLSEYTNVGNCEKILFLTPIAFKSHKNVFEPLIRGLGLRGHEMTVISPVKSSNMPKTVKEIVPVPLEDIMGPMGNVFEMRKQGKFGFLTSWNSTFVLNACNRFYEHPEVKNFFEKKFDLEFLNGLLNQCAYGMMAHFKVPIILFTTMPAPQVVADIVGNHFPPSFVPSPFSDYTDRMNFEDRIKNMLFRSIIKFAGIFYYIPMFEKLYRSHLGQDAPSMAQSHENISMIFMNSHIAMNSARPLLPSIIEVGGMHCRPAQQLPKDLEDYLSNAEDGFIYFSLGTIVKPADMPEKARKALKAFLNVFSRLKQRVIWKWDVEMPDLPKNVKILPFLPQQDILGHPKIKLFITHGGLLSTQEAIYHGVPVLGIPVFGDQDLNMRQAEKAGFCLQLEILDFSEEDLEKQIHRLLHESSFKEKATKLSQIFRDQPETPLERGIYWTEFIIRHKGAPHMRSPAIDLNFFQYHSIDVVAFLSATLLLILYIMKRILGFICKNICRYFGKCKSTPDAKKNKKTKIH